MAIPPVHQEAISQRPKPPGGGGVGGNEDQEQPNEEAKSEQQLQVQNNPLTEQWHESYENAAISGMGIETFGGSRAALVNRDRYGSGNQLLIINRDAAGEFAIRADRNLVLGMIVGIGSFKVEASDGIFFNSITLERLGALGTTAANEIKIYLSRVARK